MWLYVLSSAPILAGLILAAIVVIYSSIPACRRVPSSSFDVSMVGVRRVLRRDRIVFGLYSTAQPLALTGAVTYMTILLLFGLSGSAPTAAGDKDLITADGVVTDAFQALKPGVLDGRQIAEFAGIGLGVGGVMLAWFWFQTSSFVLKLPNRNQLDALIAAEDYYLLGKSDSGGVSLMGPKGRTSDIEDGDFLALIPSQGPNALLPSNWSYGTLQFDFPKGSRGEKVAGRRAGRRDWSDYRLVFVDQGETCAAALVGQTIAYFSEPAINELRKYFSNVGWVGGGYDQSVGDIKGF